MEEEKHINRLKMELRSYKTRICAGRRQLVKEESTDIFTCEPSIVSLNQKASCKELKEINAESGNGSKLVLSFLLEIHGA